MPFVLPSFHTGVMWWIPGNLPSLGPHDQLTLGQIFVPKDAAMVNDFNSAVWNNDEMIVEWRLQLAFQANPPLPLVNGIIGYVDYHANEWYYRVVAWEYRHVGFANEYIALWCSQCNDAGVSPDANR